MRPSLPLLTWAVLETVAVFPPGAPKIAEAGIDWVSATAPPGKRYDQLREVAACILHAQEIVCHDRRPWRWNGYEGSICGRSSWGTRPDGGYLRVSSDVAHVWYSDIWQATGSYARVDLQVTVEGLDAGYDLAQATRDAANVAPLRRGRPITWQYLQTRDKGCTAYVGSRASAVVGRVYDKGAERGGDHLSGTWRYELECKDDAADGYGRKLASAASPTAAVTGLVHKWFTTRGVPPAFSPTVEVEAPQMQLDSTDDMKRLAWLRDHVSLTVAKLVAKGYRMEVLEALGLQPQSAGALSSSARTAITGPIN